MGIQENYGLRFGTLPPGEKDAITDVPGVAVGHATVIAGSDIRTGVTAILPHPGDLFHEKVQAAAVVLNGFGKSIGIPQINELGTIETPILLTSTLSVGRAADALITWVIKHYDQPDSPIRSLNPVVGECNDSYLNDIRARAVTEEHVYAALDGASDGPVREGVVGAGTGMSAFGFKSGIGTASRLVEYAGRAYTIGVLALPNFGRREELTILGVPIGRLLPPESDAPEGDKGSIIIVIGTDLPLSHRELRRLAVRAGLGLARTGSRGHSGSGDFVIAFSTANRVPHHEGTIFLQETRLNDAHRGIDRAFQAVIEAVEEAIVSALFHAYSVTGRDGHTREALPIARVLELLRSRGALIQPGD